MVGHGAGREGGVGLADFDVNEANGDTGDDILDDEADDGVDAMAVGIPAL